MLIRDQPWLQAGVQGLKMFWPSWLQCPISWAELEEEDCITGWHLLQSSVPCPSTSLCWLHHFADTAFGLVLSMNCRGYFVSMPNDLFTFALLKVWNHFDSGSCPGQAIGVKTRLDNGVAGFIPTKFLSDKVVKRPEERVKVWKQWIFTPPVVS